MLLFYKWGPGLPKSRRSCPPAACNSLETNSTRPCGGLSHSSCLKSLRYRCWGVWLSQGMGSTLLLYVVLLEVKFLLLILSMKDWVLFFLASLSSWLCMSLPGIQSLKIQVLKKPNFIYFFRIKKEQDYNATVAVYETFIQVCFTCTKCAIYTASIFTAALSDPPWTKSQRKNPGSKD